MKHRKFIKENFALAGVLEAIKKSKSNNKKTVKMTCPDCGVIGVISPNPAFIEEEIPEADIFYSNGSIPSASQENPQAAFDGRITIEDVAGDVVQVSRKVKQGGLIMVANLPKKDVSGLSAILKAENIQFFESIELSELKGATSFYCYTYQLGG